VNGNLTETKTLSPTRDYAVFSGTFTEPGQTTSEFDLTGLTMTDGILVISSIAVPTSETLYETHSEPGTGYQNTGSWQMSGELKHTLQLLLLIRMMKGITKGI
jgi:hypothetical protein